MKSIKQITAILVMISMIFCYPAMSFAADGDADQEPAVKAAGDVSGDAGYEEDEFEDDGDVSGDAGYGDPDPDCGMLYTEMLEYYAFDGEQVSMNVEFNSAYKLVGVPKWEIVGKNGTKTEMPAGKKLFSRDVVADPDVTHYRCTVVGELNGKQYTDICEIYVYVTSLKYAVEDYMYVLPGREFTLGVSSIPGFDIKWEEKFISEDDDVDWEYEDLHKSSERISMLAELGHHYYVCTATNREDNNVKYSLEFEVNCTTVSDLYIDYPEIVNNGDDAVFKVIPEFVEDAADSDITYEWYVSKPECTATPESWRYSEEPVRPEEEDFTRLDNAKDTLTLKALDKSVFVKLITVINYKGEEEISESILPVIVAGTSDKNPTVDEPVVMNSGEGAKTIEFVPEKTGFYRFNVSDVEGGAMPVLGYKINDKYVYQNTRVTADNTEESENNGSGQNGDEEEPSVLKANAPVEGNESGEASNTEYPTVVLMLYAGETYTFYTSDSNSKATQDASYTISVNMEEEYVCEHANRIKKDARKATCTEPGYTSSAVCADCGEILKVQKETPSKGHRAKSQNYKTTCVKVGTTGRKVCADCGIVLDEGQPTKLAEHTYGAWVTAGGKTTRTCSVCEYTQTKATPVVKLSAASYTYNGKVQKPSVKVSVDGIVLTRDEYSVAYSSGSMNVGTYSAKVTLKGQYVGSATKTYVINPKGTALSKVVKGKKSFKAVWAKQLAQTTGYELRYSLKSSMSNAKTAVIAKNSTTSKTVKKLKSKKKYYVQIRTYKTAGGKKYYSAWSAKKTVKVK